MIENIVDEKRTISTQLRREIKNLRTFHNPDLGLALDLSNEIGAVSNDYNPPDDLDEIMTFQEAWHHPNDDIYSKWREAIKKEIQDMIWKGVW